MQVQTIDSLKPCFQGKLEKTHLEEEESTGLKNAQSLMQASHALFLRYTDLLSQRRLTHESQQRFEENYKNVAKEVETTTAKTNNNSIGLQRVGHDILDFQSLANTFHLHHCRYSLISMKWIWTCINHQSECLDTNEVD